MSDDSSKWVMCDGTIRPMSDDPLGAVPVAQRLPSVADVLVDTLLDENIRLEAELLALRAELDEVLGLTGR